MKYDIIKTDNYLLVVDESDIKGWYYDAYINKVKHSGGAEYGESIITRNIIAHLPLNGSPILEGVPLLPPFEIEDSNKDLFYQKQVMNPYPTGGQSYVSYEKGFIDGYNQAKEKYKYTEEDLRKAWNAAYIDAMSIDEETYKPLFFEDFIQSLSQPKIPIGFQCEMEDKIALDGHTIIGTEPITTTTPEGHTQWIGTYIYE